jgi:hypothetical protein
MNPDRSPDNMGLSFGASILNIGPDISYYNDEFSDPIPRRLLLAGGYKAIASQNYDLKITLDISKLLVDNNDGFRTEWEELVWSYGLEADLHDLIAARIGFLNNKAGRERYLTTGMGIGTRWLHADLSYIFDGDETWNRRGGEYTIGLSLNLDNL